MTKKQKVKWLTNSQFIVNLWSTMIFECQISSFRSEAQENFGGLTKLETKKQDFPEMSVMINPKS